MYKLSRLSIKIQISTGFAVQTSLNNQISIALINTSKTSSGFNILNTTRNLINQILHLTECPLNGTSVALEAPIEPLEGVGSTEAKSDTRVFYVFFGTGVYGYPNCPDSTAVFTALKMVSKINLSVWRPCKSEIR